jgi:hypothetical protein
MTFLSAEDAALAKTAADSLANAFKALLSNIAVDNAAAISRRYGEITCALNQEFRNTDSKTANSLQVGSYGRWTAIKGISDLDMLYIVPAGAWETYKTGGQYKLLSLTCEAIKARYPATTVYVDRLVVRVLYKDFHIEVQPVFAEADGSFTYPDTKDGGSWKTTKPKLEIAAMAEFDQQKNKNLRRLCQAEQQSIDNLAQGPLARPTHAAGRRKVRLQHRPLRVSHIT